MERNYKREILWLTWRDSELVGVFDSYSLQSLLLWLRVPYLSERTSVRNSVRDLDSKEHYVKSGVPSFDIRDL